MKRVFLWLIAALAMLYVLIMGPLIDPLPLLDEAAAMAVFAFSMRALGYDVTRWLPIVRRFRGGASGRRPGHPQRSQPAGKKDVVIDV